MRNRWAAVALAGLILGLASCSSGGSTAGSSPSSAKTSQTIIQQITTTTGSTLPPSQLVPALKAFFSSKGGKALLAFERASAPLATGTTLHATECKPFNRVLGRIASPDYLIVQTQTIPDPYLSKAFHDDVAVKRLYLAACETGTPLPASVGPKIKKYTNDLRAVMQKHGYTI